MDVFLIIYLLTSHFVSDYTFQSSWQATNKHNNIKALLCHTFSYSIVMGLLVEILNQFNYFGAIPWYTTLQFILIMFITHTIVDFFSSKLNHFFLRYEFIRSHYQSIAIDQLLHSSVIFFTVNYLYF